MPCSALWVCDIAYPEYVAPETVSHAEQVSLAETAHSSRRPEENPSIWSAGSFVQNDARGINDRHKLIPRFHEGLRALVLKPSSQFVYVDAKLSETR